MGKFLDALSLLKLPDSDDVYKIPSKIRTESKKTSINTVDVIYLSPDFRFCDMGEGVKVVGQTKKPIINVTIPDDLSFFGSHPIFNKTTGRELYLVDSSGLFDLDLNTVIKQSAYIKIDNGIDGGEIDFTVTQSLLNELGNFKMVSDINEKTNDGYVIIFIMGLLVGAVIMSIIMGSVLS